MCTVHFHPDDNNNGDGLLRNNMACGSKVGCCFCKKKSENF